MPDPQTAGPIERETLHLFTYADADVACAESIGLLARAVDKLTARVEALEKKQGELRYACNDTRQQVCRLS